MNREIELSSSLISIIIPMKNESATLAQLFSVLTPILADFPINYEIVAVNDGSCDDTLAKLIELSKNEINLKIIDLSRNFGKEAALYAGFSYAQGDCAVAMDADLQDPPELILEMINWWQQGYEIVTGVHQSRESDTYLKRKTANLFYQSINKVSDIKFTPNAGDFRLLDRTAINAFLSLDERVRFNKGLFAWIGFKEKLVYHKRSERTAGTSQWKYLQLFKFAIDGITSFSKAPLEVWFYLGIFTAIAGFLYGVFIFTRTILLGIDTPGYASLLIFVLFFSGLQMVGVGILGKYIGRIFIESKRRPIFIVRKIYDNLNANLHGEGNEF
ncbi:MAG: glycosyltransferase [Neisseriaceae bacterium]|nr:MAG: glycosyltransferase [Neisseriaceae bacterium]